MLVREKVDERQFEWYRDNNEFYYRLKEQQGVLFFEDGFLISILPLILSRRKM